MFLTLEVKVIFGRFVMFSLTWAYFIVNLTMFHFDSRCPFLIHLTCGDLFTHPFNPPSLGGRKTSQRDLVLV